MHIKRAYFAGEQDGESLVQIVQPGEQVKTASCILPSVQTFIDRLTPDPRYTYVLVNAMGYSEFYGSNSNRDWYGHNEHLDFNGLLHAPPGFGEDYETDKMQGRAWPYGFPSYYGATVYAHHKNTDPQQLGFGDVIYVALNPVMKRIELVERVFNEEARKKGHTSILDRIAAHERVDVSMGCKVPFDFCSICTDWGLVKKAWKTFNPEQHRHPGVAILAYHKTVKPIRGLAITRKDYCEHMLKIPGQILPDGRKVYVYNDFPRFFDISFVLVGADRTARVMWHLGSTKPMEGTSVAPWQSRAPDLARLLENLYNKVSAINVAAMEKEIPDGYAQAVKHDADTAADFSEVLYAAMDSGGDKKLMAKKILTALAVMGVVPTPKEFQSLALSAVPGGDIIKRALDEKHVTFDTAVGGIDNTFAVSEKLYDSKLASALAPMMPERSSFDPYLTSRLTSFEPKTASAPPTPIRTELLDKLAAQYNGYRISVLENAGDLFPKAAAFLGPKAGGRGIGLAALLLGLGPMISLLSSHLRNRREEGQQIGTMASFVADNPSFVTITTIGAGLRAAMELDKAGGLAQAARSVVTAARGVL